MKKADTLIEDIYNLFDPSKQFTPSEENLNLLFKGIEQAVRKSMSKEEIREESSVLRMSNVGKPSCRLWFDQRNLSQGTPTQSNYTPEKLLSFLYGSIIEHLILFLARESGHQVTNEQQQVEMSGVKGSIDCEIDGVLVDVKSASSRSFVKFATGSLVREKDDPFGYIEQLSAYAQAKNKTEAAFLGLDKEAGTLAWVKLNKSDMPDIPEKINTLKTIISSPVKPQRCFSDEPEGKSGNMTLPTACKYCPHKLECWKDANNGQGLRAFKYAKETKYLTKVVRVPEVPEITL